MAIVCGVDCSTLHRPNWVAWLDDANFFLDVYVPSETMPLPHLSAMPGEVSCIGIDAPQSLPAVGAPRRAADAAANTPTRRLPQTREELSRWRAYRGLIEAGVSIFWWVYSRRLGTIPGLSTGAETPVVLETYPRYMIRRLWPEFRIPSKRQRPMDYIEEVYARIQKRGYRCRSAIRPSVDQVDAMLCAMAAEAYGRAGGLPAGTVGIPPEADDDARVLREGLIIAA